VLAAETKPTEIADGAVRLGTELVNWYLVEEGGGVSIVDAGMPRYRPQLERGLALLGREPADVQAIVLTHAHADHVGVAEPLRTELGIRVYVHGQDERLARTKKQFGKREASLLPYLRHGAAWRLLGHLGTSGTPKAIGDVTTFADGDTLALPGRPRVLHTPGHTEGHCCLWLPDRRLLVVGDLLCTWNPLTGARGPQLLPRAFNRSSTQMLASLERIEALEAQTLVFGHGEPWSGGAGEAVERARSRGPT
jgi:glyoxylase-like metal-dependent hydrolase (beta-lactamase superfamily II)